MKQHDLTYWEEMAERYFLAETSEEEELMLRRFLCSSEGQDPRFDEVRATLAFLHVCRTQHTARVTHPLRALVIAACFCAAAFLGWYQYHQHNMSSVRIDGEMVEADASQLMQQQMAEMFNP